MIQITFQHFSEQKVHSNVKNVLQYLFYVLPFIANIFSLSHIDYPLGCGSTSNTNSILKTLIPKVFFFLRVKLI